MARASRFIYLLALAAIISVPCATHAQTGLNIGTWGTAPMGPPARDAGEKDMTLREIVHVSIGSSQYMSVTLSNEFGLEPLTIGEAAVAKHTHGDGASNPVQLLFSGKPEVVIPPGGRVTSDLTRFEFPALSDVVVSLFVPAQKMTRLTQHIVAHATNYIAPGNQVDAKTLTKAKPVTSWRYLRGIEVNVAGGGDIVCLGDSITDGARSTMDANLRWPDLLAVRLQTNPDTKDLGVLNEGIGGNRIMHDGFGQSALKRFERDVLANPHVRYLVILEGINDIGRAYAPLHPTDKVDADELIAAYGQMIKRAHAHGIKVIGATLTPYAGAGYFSPQGETVRSALNTWIRTTNELDGVIDFDKAMRDPANPIQLMPIYNSGDHLHPNDLGRKAMTDSIDLKLFTK